MTKSHKTGRSRTAGAKSAATRSRTKPAAKKKGKSSAAKAQPAPATTSEDEAAFTEAVIASGEAKRLDEQGKLPAGATHKIVEDEHGNVKVVRRRFSMT